MKEMQLDERKKAILEAVIKDYVETAEPVGSRAIVRKHNLGISAATVRNEMADLVEMGFLEQPHTSAGRIPSETGFRYYVDYMMVKERLSPEEEAFLYQVLTRKVEDLSAVIQATGQALAQLTKYAAVVVSPSFSRSQIKHLQLMPIGFKEALVVVVTDVGTVLHKKIDVPESIRPEDLEEVSRLFNKNLQGLQLAGISKSMLRSIRTELLYRRELIEKALEAVETALAEEEDEKVYVSGTVNILNQPEFKDFEKLKKILVALEEHQLIKSLLSETGMKEVRIKIGTENALEGIKELSIVFSSYEVDGKDMGRIALIGPVRMEYWRASATVEKVKEIIQEVLARIVK